MSPTAAILSQGDEVVTGQTPDTNAAWIAEQLTALGLRVVRHVTVGDRVDDIAAALSALAAEADVVVCTGGLGPTDDDLTALAFARAFDRPLRLDEQALADLEAKFRTLGRAMAPSNHKQVLLPERAVRLDNARGTAPGFALDAPGAALVACLPGVPHEMRAMFEGAVVPRIAVRHALRPGRLVVLHTAGVGESVLQDRIGAFTHPSAVIGYRARTAEVEVKLRFDADAAEAIVVAVTEDVAARIGSPVYGIEGLPSSAGKPGAGSLAEVIGRALIAQGRTLAIAESCTGGGLSARCTALAGASAWFVEGCVTYTNEAKVERLRVPASLIAAHGAVSEPVARAMAEGIRLTSGATYGLGVTGIAGPDGGTIDKPVGTVHLALATPAGTVHRKLRLTGDRHRIQAHAAVTALDLLRRHLQGLPVS
jgi:nicotinamide-nucleotide amidase